MVVGSGLHKEKALHCLVTRCRRERALPPGTIKPAFLPDVDLTPHVILKYLPDGGIQGADDKRRFAASLDIGRFKRPGRRTQNSAIRRRQPPAAIFLKNHRLEHVMSGSRRTPACCAV